MYSHDSHGNKSKQEKKTDCGFLRLKNKPRDTNKIVPTRQVGATVGVTQGNKSSTQASTEALTSISHKTTKNQKQKIY